MADKKITELSEISAVSDDDLLILVNDPEGTPSSRKVSVENFNKGFNLRYLVRNNANSSFRFTGAGQSSSANNPPFRLYSGFTYIFDDSTDTFRIVSEYGGSEYPTGITRLNGVTTFKVPHTSASANLYYEHTEHDTMRGRIYIV